MPDITMCNGINCPLKDNCYRHTATPSNYQSYFTESPIENNECDYFWKDKNTSVTTQLEVITKIK